MRKFLIFSVSFLLLIVFTAIISLRFFPKLYVSAFNRFSEQQISTEQLKITFIPFEVNVGNLDVSNSQHATILTAEQVKFAAQLEAWFNEKKNFWKASVGNADVHLLNLPQTSSDSQSPNSSNSIKTKINAHRILSGLDLKIDGLQIRLDEKQTIHVQRLHTKLNDNNLSNYKKIEQDIDFQVSFFATADQEKPSLQFNGLLQSRYVDEDDVSLLKLAIPSINLSSLIPINDANSETLSSATTTPIEPKTPTETTLTETTIDWQWLSLFDPLQVEADIDEILWSKSAARNVDFSIKLDQSMIFSFESAIAWLESNQINFEENVRLTGDWQPISQASVGADLRGESTVSMPTFNMKFSGDVNVNGTTGNALSIELDSSKLPVKGLLDKKTQALVNQYFPVKTKFDLQLSEKIIKLQLAEAILGESDVKGLVSLTTSPTEPLDINTQLESTLFSYRSGNKNKVKRSQKTPTANSKNEKNIETNKKTIFNDDTIDWAWLDALLINFDWKAKRILVDDIEIKNMHLPLSLSKGKLAVSGFDAVLGEGRISSDTFLTKIEQGIDVDFNLTAKDVVLEQLQLLPPEELKKTVTDLSVALTTKGQSSRALAQSLNGKFQLNMSDGIIGNDSFELIGSDLILGLLNKLNPFSKKDKTTKLECAAVNLDIEKGKINIDKSVALRTSKLNIVADGFVDLSTEKIKLDITPKARKNIGVDISSLAKFIALGGTLTEPKPVVTASGLVKSAIVIGAAASTGGVSLLATNAVEKTVGKVDVCERANKAF